MFDLTAVSRLTAARASIKSHSMSLLISILTKTALSVGGLLLFHSLRETATGVTRPSVASPPQAGTGSGGGGGGGRGGNSFSVNYGELQYYSPKALL